MFKPCSAVEKFSLALSKFCAADFSHKKTLARICRNRHVNLLDGQLGGGLPSVEIPVWAGGGGLALSIEFV